jgi:hypothetical protein
MKLALPDGRTLDADKGVQAAFAAFAQGRATAGQQKLCLQWLMDMTQPMAIAAPNAGERATGMCDGARVIGNTIARLVGGESPWTLAHLGDVKHDD